MCEITESIGGTRERWSHSVLFPLRQCSECDQASSDEADIAMETLPDGTKRSRRQIKGPLKFIPQEMSPEPKKHQVRLTVWCIYTLRTTLSVPGRF